MFKGEELIINKEMALKTLRYLDEKFENSQAAFGLLRLCF